MSASAAEDRSGHEAGGLPMSAYALRRLGHHLPSRRLTLRPIRIIRHQRMSFAVRLLARRYRIATALQLAVGRVAAVAPQRPGALPEHVAIEDVNRLEALDHDCLPRLRQDLPGARFERDRGIEPGSRQRATGGLHRGPVASLGILLRPGEHLAPGQLEPMYLSVHRIAGNTAKLRRNLRGRQSISP